MTTTATQVRSRYAPKCSICHAPIKPGEKISWDPKTRRVTHTDHPGRSA